VSGISHVGIRSRSRGAAGRKSQFVLELRFLLRLCLDFWSRDSPGRPGISDKGMVGIVHRFIGWGISLLLHERFPPVLKRPFSFPAVSVEAAPGFEPVNRGFAGRKRGNYKASILLTF
jgi:hypothetical protein